MKCDSNGNAVVIHAFIAQPPDRRRDNTRELVSK
jgi:hypothetical protein